jgi:hypothetical protein
MGCLSGCADSGGHLLGPRVPGLPKGAFETSPESLIVDGVRYDVDAFLWRDFMPTTPPGGSGLKAAVVVTAPPGKSIPDGLHPLWLWARNKEAVWAAELEQQQGTSPDEIRLAAWNGPSWGPGIEVDLVLGVMTPGGKLQLTAIRGVPIERTD